MLHLQVQLLVATTQLQQLLDDLMALLRGFSLLLSGVQIGMHRLDLSHNLSVVVGKSLPFLCDRSCTLHPVCTLVEVIESALNLCLRFLKPPTLLPHASELGHESGKVCGGTGVRRFHVLDFVRHGCSK